MFTRDHLAGRLESVKKPEHDNTLLSPGVQPALPAESQARERTCQKPKMDGVSEGNFQSCLLVSPDLSQGAGGGGGVGERA